MIGRLTRFLRGLPRNEAKVEAECWASVPPTFLPDLLLKTGARTPCYVVDMDRVEATYDAFAGAFAAHFPHMNVAYSFKSNCMRPVTQLIHSKGGWAEVVSGAEFQVAIQDGFHGSEICFDGPVKLSSEVDLALTQGALVQADSTAEVKLIVERCRAMGVTPRVGLRLATPRGRGSWSRLGHSPSDFEESDRLLRDAQVELAGVHFNSGAHRLNPDSYSQMIGHWGDQIGRVFKHGSRSRRPILDIGGGFPAHSAGRGIVLRPWNEYAEAVGSAVRAVGFGEDDVHLIVEPGRSLVEDHGYLVLSVVATKKRDKKTVVVVDGGVNLVNSLRSWYHPMLAVPTGKDRMRVYGSMCFENDLLHEALPCSSTPEDGTKVVIGSVGAYDIACARGWIRRLPDVWCLAGGDLNIVSEECGLNENRIASINY